MLPPFWTLSLSHSLATPSRPNDRLSPIVLTNSHSLFRSWLLYHSSFLHFYHLRHFSLLLMSVFLSSILLPFILSKLLHVRSSCEFCEFPKFLLVSLSLCSPRNDLFRIRLILTALQTAHHILRLSRNGFARYFMALDGSSNILSLNFSDHSIKPASLLLATCSLYRTDGKGIV